MVYALDDFHFIEKLPIPFYATCFEQLDDAHFIWYVNAGLQNQGGFQKHLQVTDLDCRPVSSWVDVMEMPQQGCYNVTSYFHGQDAEVRFHHPFSGDYYSCSLAHPNLLQFVYSLKFESLPFPSLDYVQAHRDNIVKDFGKTAIPNGVKSGKIRQLSCRILEAERTFTGESMIACFHKHIACSVSSVYWKRLRTTVERAAKHGGKGNGAAVFFHAVVVLDA